MNVRGQLHLTATLSPAKATSTNLATESDLTRWKKGKSLCSRWEYIPDYAVVRSSVSSLYWLSQGRLYRTHVQVFYVNLTWIPKWCF